MSAAKSDVGWQIALCPWLSFAMDLLWLMDQIASSVVFCGCALSVLGEAAVHEVLTKALRGMLLSSQNSCPCFQKIVWNLLLVQRQ